jgi:PST family polysaccharide transporter
MSLVNFFHLSLNQGINVIVALVVTQLLFQKLGEDQYGLVNLGFSIVLLLGIMVNYGFQLNGPKRLALIVDTVHAKSQLVNEILITKVILSVLLSSILLVCVYVFGFFAHYHIILVLSITVLLSEALFPMFILQGLDHLSLLSKANIFAKSAYLCAIIVVIKSPLDAKWVNFIYGSAAILSNFVLLVYIYKKWSLKFRWVNLNLVLRRLKENFQFFLSTIAGHISVHGGLIILSNFVSDIELGRYALAQRVAFLLRMIPVFLTQSILQHASRLHSENKTSFVNYLKKAYRNGLLLTFLVGVVFVIMAPWVIRIVSGEFVDYSSDVLRLLSFIPFFGMLNVSNMIKILVAENKEVLARAAWVTATTMLLISTVGSYYFGGYGLAISLLLTELINCLIHTYLLRKKN